MSQLALCKDGRSIAAHLSDFFPPPKSVLSLSRTPPVGSLLDELADDDRKRPMPVLAEDVLVVASSLAGVEGEPVPAGNALEDDEGDRSK